MKDLPVATPCPAAPRSRASIKSPDRSAFTLIELLVTVVILATGIVLVLRAFNTAVVALDEARTSLDAVWLVRNRLVELDIEATAEGALVPGRETGRGEGRAAAMFWESWVEPVDMPSGGDGTNSLYKVTIAAWRENHARRYSVATYVRGCRK